jgi:hypothetical protein
MTADAATRRQSSRSHENTRISQPCLTPMSSTICELWLNGCDVPSLRVFAMRREIFHGNIWRGAAGARSLLANADGGVA